MNGGQLPTNQLHDINWGALDHASRAPQLMSCNYTVCVCVCSVKLNCNCSLRKAFTHASNQDTFKVVVVKAKVQLPNTSFATIKGV